MKNINTKIGMIILAMFIMAMAFTITPAQAGSGSTDQILDTTIESVTVKNDKNGDEYVRYIVLEKANLNGVEYTKGISLTGFSSSIDMTQAKEYKAGDPIKAIVTPGDWNGRKTYTLVAFIE